MLLIAVTALDAQGFIKGKTYLGPTIGYGLGFGYGAGVEHAIFDKIGIGAEIAMQSFEESGNFRFGNYNYEWKWKYNLFGALLAATYHFNKGKEFDPFVRVGIGYFNYNAEYTDNEGSSLKYNNASYTSGLGYTGQLGFRYHISESSSLRATVGYPFYVAGGIDFTLN